MSFSITGKTAIVTGSAHGVGLAIARHFVEAGANVMFADMDEASLQEELGDEAEGTARFFAGDLRQKLTIANLLSATVDAFERVDILVNATRQVIPSEALDPEQDNVGAMIDQNLMTSLRLSQQVAARMIKQREEDDDGPAGAIVNLSSIAARRTSPALLGYSVACAALDQMTRSLAVSLAPHRIRVNSVAFGSVMSASLKDALKSDSDMRDEIVQHTPMGRIAQAKEVASAVQYLSADASSFVTGQVLTVDGGRTLIDAVAVPAH